MSEEESFEVRVKRLFGSHLFEKVPENSFPETSWSVSHGEVERREWNRGPSAGGRDREDDPCAAAFDDPKGCFAKRPSRAERRKKDWEGDLDGLEDEDEGVGEGGGGEGYGGDDEREIRASVGLDPTLDHEEEEDEYDRRAFNMESAEERVYMRDIMDRGPHLNIHSVVPDYLDEPYEVNHAFSRDPRADHFAAVVRLKEEKEAEGGCHAVLKESHEDAHVLSQNKFPQDELKPILKRKESQIDPKPKKRVRFDPGCIDDGRMVIEEPQNSHMVPHVMETGVVSKSDSHFPEVSTGIPDYLRNPSKYTCYTLDGTDKDDNETNKRAFNEFRSLVKSSESESIPVEPPASITFRSRKRLHEMSTENSTQNSHEESCKESSRSAICSMSSAEGTDDDASHMEEDDVSVGKVVVQQQKVRNYRSKSQSYCP